MIRYIEEAVDLARLQWKSFAVVTIIMTGVYYASVHVMPGWGTWLVTVPPGLIIAITALARVNDIGPERMGTRWQVRKVGLIMAGSGAVMMLATPFLDSPSYPTWRAVVLIWGVALAWLTTPAHPPWDYYITGKYRFLTHAPPPLTPPPVRDTPSDSEVASLMEAERRYQNKRRRGDGDGP